jgi:hypothetical protein
MALLFRASRDILMLAGSSARRLPPIFASLAGVQEPSLRASDGASAASYLTGSTRVGALAYAIREATEEIIYHCEEASGHLEVCCAIES